MILKAKHHFFLFFFFKRYSSWKLKSNFRDIRIIGSFNDKKLPVLLIANHISWWDGFWAYYLNKKIFKRKFHFMMLETQLRKYWFFNYLGGFSVNKGAKSINETVSYTSELLSSPKNMVLIFPQGKIHSMHQQTFQFEKGIERILTNTKSNIQILFMANLVDYFSNSKPIVNSYIQEYEDFSNSKEDIQNNYNSFYQCCLDAQSKINED